MTLCYSSDLVEMAHGTDLLVNGAIDEPGPIAQEAKAKHPDVPLYADLGTTKVDRNKWHRDAQRGYCGQATFSQGLDRFTLPAHGRRG